MQRIMAMLLGSLACGAVLAPGALGQIAPQPPSITEQEVQAIGMDAYLYFYPLVTMDLTRKQLTNAESGKQPGRGPMNMFHNIPAYPAANDRTVVRPNFDTLYSIAYLDLTNGPVVVSVPDTDGRYY